MAYIVHHVIVQAAQPQPAVAIVRPGQERFVVGTGDEALLSQEEIAEMAAIDEARVLVTNTVLEWREGLGDSDAKHPLVLYLPPPRLKRRYTTEPGQKTDTERVYTGPLDEFAIPPEKVAEFSKRTNSVATEPLTLGIVTDVLVIVFGWLDTPSMRNVARTCARWYFAARKALAVRLVSSPQISAAIHLTAHQFAAWKLAVEHGKSIFITGEAGCGKTALFYSISWALKGRSKSVSIVAPTGIAAQLIGGRTICGFFGLTPEDLERIERLQESARRDYAIGHAKSTLYTPQAALVRTLDTIMIDEISMVSIVLFDFIDQLMRVWTNKPSLPFGGVQVICSGDFCQLPPVSRGNVVQPCPFSNAWAELYGNIIDAKNPSVVLLPTPMRQTGDPVLSAVLRELRHQRPSVLVSQFLRSRSAIRLLQAKDPILNKQVACITAKRGPADKFNNDEAKRVGSVPRAFAAVDQGGTVAELETGTNLLTQLVLSIGCRVALMKNYPHEQLSNGSHGTVQGIVRLSNPNVAARCALAYADHLTRSEREGGLRILSDRTKRFRWRDKTEVSVDYELHEKEEFPVVKFDQRPNLLFIVCSTTRTHNGAYRRQIPLRLGYASTVHSAQGWTLDGPVSLDLADCWEPSQVYVALSRVRRADQLIIASEPDYDRVYKRAVSSWHASYLNMLALKAEAMRLSLIPGLVVGGALGTLPSVLAPGEAPPKKQKSDGTQKDPAPKRPRTVASPPPDNGADSNGSSSSSTTK